MLERSPRISDEMQARFVAQFGMHDDGNVRLVPEALFTAKRGNDNRESIRLYHNEKFGFKTGAFYGKEMKGLPDRVIKLFGHNNHQSISLPDFKPHSGGLSFSGRQGDYSFSVQYYPHEGEDQSPMYYLGMVDERTSRYAPGYRALFMPVWTEIKDNPNVDEILAKRGIKYDREEGVFEAKFDELILRVRATASINGILDRYFPSELREDPLEAGIEQDVWARADWLQDFGITWTREIKTEVPIFTS